MEEIAGIVLAGGQSRRMGGGDKALLKLGKRPVLAEVVARLAPQAGSIVLSANGDPARFAAFGMPVVPDSRAEFQGPLAGIEAGLSWVRAACPGVRFAVTVPGDTPFIPPDLVQRLAEGRGDAPMAVAVSTAGLHPVIGLWPVAMAEGLAEALARGERRASAFVRAHGAAEVAFGPIRIGGAALDPFFNINTPEDLDLARGLCE
ncbi:hypothetical protein AUC68_00290 [Methyloceanibacter methanicus]|uniref:Molybdenum cofactor guanylyltransferase n=2 Tax=Methyloceanibacter methanicus TaxID=1774968 RepID=A0A1E3W6C5_9HYPH|nr:hypothetical protein AUC68_00290 [Methyloceanibacter methanicus]